MAFLVVGDPFGATTHADLMIRARELGIKTKTIHNASIMNAIGCCGLQLYSFGETVSIPFWTEDWQPDSFFDKIQVNFISSIFDTGSNNQFQNPNHEFSQFLMDHIISVKKQSVSNTRNSL